jgi:hypothetical protein
MDSFFRTSSPAFVVCFPDCHSSWNSHFTFEYHLACILFWLKMLNISSSIGHFNFVWDPFNSFAHLLIELLILLVFNFFELCLYSGYESFVCRIAGKDFISFCRVSLHFVIVFFFYCAETMIWCNSIGQYLILFSVNWSSIQRVLTYSCIFNWSVTSSVFL